MHESNLVWHPAGQSKGLDKDPLRMAEPQHRIPPAGASTLQSIRELPKSCIQKVKEICLFYVQKVSGDYVDNKAAARYVHHLAEEVIAQLAGVAEEIKRNRTDPELFQALINEWNAYFPKSLQSMGSPKHIAMLLKQQEHEIQKLKNELDNVQRKRDNDIQELLRSMDNQLSVYKQSVLTEREDNARKAERLLESHRRELRQMQLQLDERVRELQREGEVKVQEARQLGVGELDKLRADFDGRLRETKKEHAAQTLLLQKKLGILVNKNARYRDKYLSLSQKYTAVVSEIVQNSSGSTSASKHSVELQHLLGEVQEDRDVVGQDSNDFLDVESLEELDVLVADGDGDNNASSLSLANITSNNNNNNYLNAGTSPPSPTGGNSVSSAPPLTARRRSSVALRDVTRDYTDEKRERVRLEEANLIANAQVGALRKQLEATQGALADARQQVEMLRDEVKDVYAERSVLLGRLQELERMVMTYQLTLETKLKCDIDAHYGKHELGVSAPDPSVISPTPEVLCHTPHFLGKRDKKGALRNAETVKVKGYMRSGHF